jgi:hypothetical protein
MCHDVVATEEGWDILTYLRLHQRLALWGNVNCKLYVTLHMAGKKDAKTADLVGAKADLVSSYIVGMYP